MSNTFSYSVRHFSNTGLYFVYEETTALIALQKLSADFFYNMKRLAYNIEFPQTINSFLFTPFVLDSDLKKELAKKIFHPSPVVNIELGVNFINTLVTVNNAIEYCKVLQVDSVQSNPQNAVIILLDKDKDNKQFIWQMWYFDETENDFVVTTDINIILKTIYIIKEQL